MATFSDKYRKGDGGGTTSFASLYRKDASGNAPLGSARDEQMRLTKRSEEIRKKVAAAQAEAEKFAQEANRYGTVVNVLESIGKSFVRPAISLYQGITQPMRSAFGLSPASGTYNVPVLGPTETYQNQANRVVSDIRSQGGSLGRAAVATAGIAAQPAIDVLSTVYTPAKIALGFRWGKIIGAGIQGAKVGAPISVAQSLADSAVEGKDAKQAAIDAAKATLFGAGAGFGLGVFGGAVGEGASSFARFYRKGASETAEQVAKKVETKPVEKPPVKTSEKSEPKVNTANDDIKDQVSKEKVDAATSKPGGGYGYTVPEKKKIYSEIVEPKIKAAGKLADDEVYAFSSGKLKNGDYVNTDIDKIWDYPVDKDFEVRRVKRSQLDSTGNADKDGIGYRLYKEQPAQEVPKVELPKEKAIPPTTKPSGVAEKSESPVLKELNQRLDDVSKLDENLPVTTFKRELSSAEEAINKAPKEEYNKAVYGTGKDSSETRSAKLLILLENAIQKGDDKAIAEIGMAAAKHARKSGQESAMFRALYEKDPMNRLLVDIARQKMANVVTRYPKLLRRFLKEDGSDPITSAKKVIKSKAPTIKDAQSIIDNFICK